MQRRDVLVAAGFATASSSMPAIVSGLGALPRAADLPAGFQGGALGTGYRVSLGVAIGGSDLRALRARARTILAEIDREMSTFRSDSEIARLSGAPVDRWMALSADTVLTLAEAKRVSSLSSGAFDPTVGPLVDLWGFGPRGLEGFPRDGDVADALGRVDFSSLELDPGQQQACRRREDLALDLCGIAKGRAVDRLAEMLDSYGVERYLVDVGGELRARGERPGVGPWRVGIEHPEASKNSSVRVLALEDLTIATSGDYRSFFLRDGRRYSHTVDPRLGRPVTHGLSSVSVLAETALTADAFSTALMVLGPEAGMTLADDCDIAVQMLVRENGRLVEHLSPRFREYLSG